MFGTTEEVEVKRLLKAVKAKVRREKKMEEGELN